MSVTSPALNNGLCTDLQSCAIGVPKHSDIELETVPSLRPFHLSQFCSCDLLGLKLSHMRSRHPSAHSSTSSSVHIEGYPARVHDFLRTQIQRRAFNRVDRANCCACFTLRCRRRYRACNWGFSLLIPNMCSSIFGFASLSTYARLAFRVVSLSRRICLSLVLLLLWPCPAILRLMTCFPAIPTLTLNLLRVRLS